MKALADEWRNKNIPPQPNTTTVLRVEMIRQEYDPTTGSWGTDTTLPPLQNVNLQPMVPENANHDVAQAYQTWAEAQENQIALLQPPFYSVTQGDPWLFPGQALIAPNAAAQAFTPANVKPADVKNLTPEQKKEYDDWRKAEAERKKQENIQRWQQTHPKSGGGGGAPPGGGYRPVPGGGDSTSYAPRDTDRPPTLLAQAYPPRTGRYVPPPVEDMPDDMGPRTGAAPGQPPLPPGAPAPGPIPPIGPVPNPGSFDPIAASSGVGPNGQPVAPQPAVPGVPLPPGQVAPPPALGPGDVTIWAHDDSVQPGHTYRYKLRYILRNPVFQTTGVCKPQSLAATFWMKSVDSAWSPDINVKSETNFFAVNTSPVGGRVKFDIFRWKNGIWQQQTVDATPGDMVGSTQGTGTTAVDFKTGLTLVDVRPDPKNADNRIIILTGDNGQMVRHDLAADRENEEYKKLRDLIKNQNKPPTAGAAANAGQ
jgi:hypothetical protein